MNLERVCLRAGTLPASLGQQAGMSNLQLDNNLLSGTLPTLFPPHGMNVGHDWS